MPRDIATREIFQVCIEGKGVGGENQVYLDLTHIPAETLDRKLGAILEIYEMFVGDDPRHVPMRIFPGVHYSMGGLWVDYDQRTNIPGLLAAGECDYSIHGANRLGANSLVSCVYGGFVAAPAAIEYAKNVERNGADGSRIYDQELKRQQEINDALIKQSGNENQYVLHQEMGKWMTDNVTVVRYNDKLKATDNKLLELMDRYKRISINDSNLWATMALPHARHLDNMLELARVITLGALNRNESRGAHYKPEFPDRDDENFLKTTIAEYSGEGPVFSYEPVDISLITAAQTRLQQRQEGNRKELEALRSYADCRAHLRTIKLRCHHIPPKTVEIHIRRRANPDSPQYWEQFEIPYRPNLNIISCLMEIQKNPVTKRASAPRRRSGT